MRRWITKIWPYCASSRARRLSGHASALPQDGNYRDVAAADDEWEGCVAVAFGALRDELNERIVRSALKMEEVRTVEDLEGLLKLVRYSTSFDDCYGSGTRHLSTFPLFLTVGRIALSLQRRTSSARVDSSVPSEGSRRLAKLSAQHGAPREIGIGVGKECPRVLFESRHIIVMSKPSYWVVNPEKDATCNGGNRRRRELSLERLVRSVHPAPYHELIRQLWGVESEVNRDPLRSYGLCSRLDLETSGLLPIARSDVAYTWLRLQWDARIPEKYYVCLVHGHVPEGLHTCSRPIKATRFTHNSREYKISTVDTTAGSPALTYWQPLAYFRRYDMALTLLYVRIVTGRTHQIRLHCSEQGFPLVGDRKYCGKGRLASSAADDKTWSTRIFLHAARLSFYDLPSDRFVADGDVRSLGPPLSTAAFVRENGTVTQ
ncbi:unnamed protein product [Vitrella brassicaformis CCMP3155]|uniref:Pseudouridine synthase RsuA/RluA-like domain-containing protein n=1 Tax=Vitrella brassicaformis (strain CCMP3155) TaxID=1169540 RepID=A0A0G4E9D7_VITBC|nr:unnamed protein product [Vitrella brassicaformis CCMP3155]|eukprot:CEL91844.1 unnamed protein product [Vitrella brassicaformis CCMP3155]